MASRRWTAGALAVGVAGLAIVGGTTRRFEIREQSMHPTLEPGDWVIARRRSRSPVRGDIVVLRDPGGSGMNLVKRVIGLPNEHIELRNGRVTVDGAILADRWGTGTTDPDGSWDVPPDHVWVLGDNRGASRSDGRTLGSTPIEAIGWKVIARYWPLTRIGTIPAS